METVDGWLGVIGQEERTSRHRSRQGAYQKVDQEAIALADESEAAVVVVGLTDEWESEGYDRQSMALPGDQNELVQALASKVKHPERLIFVNQSGSTVEVPWIDDVSTFLQAWYGGQEAGNALADVLLGSTDPCGRLPITWPKRYAGLPFANDPETWPGVDGVVVYKEDTHVGYPRWISLVQAPSRRFPTMVVWIRPELHQLHLNNSKG
ncbi:hypothetical protein ACJZ2D_011155 [Fusarium nematophilum]